MKCLARQLVLTRGVALILIHFLVTGCATSGSQFYRDYGNGTTASGYRVFLSDEQEIPSAIEKFTRTNYMDEVGKINYLLSRMRASSYQFIRNGHVYAGDKGAMWLRWKLHNPYFKRHPVKTAQQFIDTVANMSLQSGLPYLIRYPDGSRHPLDSILENELSVLEKYLATQQLAKVHSTQAGAAPRPTPLVTASVSSQN